jgi:hypothetical protein
MPTKNGSAVRSALATASHAPDSARSTSPSSTQPSRPPQALPEGHGECGRVRPQSARHGAGDLPHLREPTRPRNGHGATRLASRRRWRHPGGGVQESASLSMACDSTRRTECCPMSASLTIRPARWPTSRHRPPAATCRFPARRQAGRTMVRRGPLVPAPVEFGEFANAADQRPQNAVVP